VNILCDVRIVIIDFINSIIKDFEKSELIADTNTSEKEFMFWSVK
jgi:hypothetical protein